MSALSWQPTASLQNLQRRGELLWTIRQFFHARGLIEVQTPILSHDSVIDRHIDPVVLPGTQLGLPDSHLETYYLQTSPEFCMKRLLAAGMRANYEISSVFRAGERGQFHNPEFTMLEWYVVDADLQQGVDLLADLVRTALQVQQVEQLTYQAAFQRALGLDPLSASLTLLSQAAVRLSLGVDPNWSDDRDQWLDLLFSEGVQPRLGQSHPSIVTHYPASQAALAQTCHEDPRTAQRYELFVDGIELANGYHELLDAAELERRNAIALAQRAKDGKPPMAQHSRLVDAMRSGLPRCSGCALGIDRLLMVATGANSIEQVLPFPIERA